MSKQLDYDQFCIEYSLDKESEQAEADYRSYIEKLDLFNNIMAESISNKAIEKAKKASDS